MRQMCVFIDQMAREQAERLLPGTPIQAHATQACTHGRAAALPPVHTAKQPRKIAPQIPSNDGSTPQFGAGKTRQCDAPDNARRTREKQSSREPANAQNIRDKYRTVFFRRRKTITTKMATVRQVDGACAERRLANRASPASP